MRGPRGGLADLRLQHRRLQHRCPGCGGMPNVINMDGMEWTRARWGLAKQAILLGNERIAGWVGRPDHRRPSRDRPLPAASLRRSAGGDHRLRRPRGDLRAHRSRSPSSGLRRAGTPWWSAGPIPENSVREIVTAWSRRPRGMPLLVVGPYARGRSVRPSGRARQPRRRCGSPGRSSTGRLQRTALPRRLVPARTHRRRHQPVAGGGDGGRQRGGRARQSLQPLGRRIRTTPTSRPTDDLAALLDDLVGDADRRRAHGRGEPGALPGRVHLGTGSVPSTSRRC